ncbi:MAG: TIGR03364 family FAD-dependent oxidoreductase [Fimbriimonadaceae bacterium]|nr:TIGR03364 family FAD-dependent oxidoreductase [Fimbriimonadaceae bacterium]
MNRERADAVVVGAGIIGLAHAYHLARAGKSVIVIERDVQAQAATVRNFGMIWPIGQPIGERRTVADRSRALWQAVARDAGLWHRECGSYHLAYAEDELTVLREFAERSEGRARMATAAEVAAHAPVVRSERLLGAMRSDTELCVDPRRTAHDLAAYLVRAHGVRFVFGSAALAIEPGRVATADSEYVACQVFACPGTEFSGPLAPLLQGYGIVKCQLNMLRARPDAGVAPLDTHLCAGLTLIHYENFRICPSLPMVRARFAETMAPYVNHGIHLLVSEHGDGSWTIGDSHTYGEPLPPYAPTEFDDLILRYLDTFLPVDRMRVTERWIGVYGKHPERPWIIDPVESGLTICTGLGGAGMTLSFGVAELSVAAAGG